MRIPLSLSRNNPATAAIVFLKSSRRQKFEHGFEFLEGRDSDLSVASEFSLASTCHINQENSIITFSFASDLAILLR